MAKDLPAMWETRYQSLGWEDPLERGIVATHSSILFWRIQWTKESLWGIFFSFFRASLVAQMVKNMPVMQET